MTREIALYCMKSASEITKEVCEECPIYGQTGSDHCFEDALQYVIGMLEQEPTTKIEESNFSQEQYLADMQSAYDCGKAVLDKIRTEIEKEIDRDDHADEYCDGYYDGMRKALAIIDKYKAESEEEA